jgi:hypothetical protein
MAVIIDKNVSIITATTPRVKSVTVSFDGKKYVEALEECGFKEGDKLEGTVDFDARSGKIVFNVRSFK